MTEIEDVNELRSVLSMLAKLRLNASDTNNGSSHNQGLISTTTDDEYVAMYAKGVTRVLSPPESTPPHSVQIFDYVSQPPTSQQTSARPLGAEPMQSPQSSVVSEGEQGRATALAYRLIRRRKAGGRSGGGGRRRGTRTAVRRHHSQLTESVLSSRILHLETCGLLSLRYFFGEMSFMTMRGTHSRGIKASYEGHVCALEGNMIGMVAKFTRWDGHAGTRNVGKGRNESSGDEEVAIRNARDRHVICTWVGRRGMVRCSCIGSTLFQSISVGGTFETPCCVHAHSFYGFFREVFDLQGFPSQCLLEKMRLLATHVASKVEMPVPYTCFKGSVILQPSKESPEQSETGSRWVPIRKNLKVGSLTCAFCDNESANNCYHIREWRKFKENLIVDPTASEPDQGMGYSTTESAAAIAMGLDADFDKPRAGRSHLPIEPINCAASVRFDDSLRSYVTGEVRNGEIGAVYRKIYVVKAPCYCNECGEHRKESSRKLFSEGILSSSYGPVRMQVETFKCGSEECRSLVFEEGRRAHIVFYSLTSASTHAFMRREVQAVVSAGIKITSRFENYVREKIEDRSSGLFPSQVRVRGIRTLTNLFALTLQLMVMDPPPQLFSCRNCGGGKWQGEAPDLCIDAIWAGCDRGTSYPFVTVSEKCDALPAPNQHGKPGKNQVRPKTGLFVDETAGIVLLAALRGERDFMSDRRLLPALSVLRVLCPALDGHCRECRPIFSVSPGTAENMYMLATVRAVTEALFKRGELESRIATAIIPFLKKEMNKRPETGVPSTSEPDPKRRKKETPRAKSLSPFCVPAVSSIILALGSDQNRVGLPALATEGGVCWTDAAYSISERARKNMMGFYRVIIQGPLTQFILKSDLESWGDTALQMLSLDEADLRGYIVNCFRESGRHVLKSRRILMAAINGVLELQSSSDTVGCRYHHLIGDLMQAAGIVVSHFYTLYDAFTDELASAMTYRRNWERTSVRRFRSYIRRRKRDYEGHNDVFRSGMFFPNYPQVRPLSFNDMSDFKGKHRDYGMCGTHYNSLRDDFTPGAITCCCSCRHPIIFGFKILERGEGPRAVMDMLMSRFPKLPRFIVYDFACGLLKSSQHTLWWAILDTTFLSDRFHIGNHTCHNGFHPDSHNEMNGRNTLSHEQRNRPIAKMKESLRNCSQVLYTSLLSYHTIYLNLQAIIRNEIDREHSKRTPTAEDIVKRTRAKRNTSPSVRMDEALHAEEIQRWFFGKLSFVCRCCDQSAHV